MMIKTITVALLLAGSLQALQSVKYGCIMDKIEMHGIDINVKKHTSRRDRTSVYYLTDDGFLIKDKLLPYSETITRAEGNVYVYKNADTLAYFTGDMLIVQFTHGMTSFSRCTNIPFDPTTRRDKK